MTKSIPIIHSVLDAAPLADKVAQHYDLPGPIHVELLTRGINDVYEVRDGSGRIYALRVWRTTFRSEADVNYETAFLAFLQGEGLPVSAAIPARGGKLYAPVRALEGPRFFALFEWAEGATYGKNPDLGIAKKLGELIAEAHRVAHRFRPPVPRVTDTAANLRRQLPHVQRMVQHKPDDRAFYTEVVEKIAAKFDTLKAGKDLPRGATHGDFHVYNAFVAPGGKITLLDFDSCGDDYFVTELTCFAWANEYVKMKPGVTEAFRAGYESVRALTQREKDLTPFFYLAKEMRFLSGFATNVNAVGHTPLLFPDLDWFSTSIRGHVKEAGL